MNKKNLMIGLASLAFGATACDSPEDYSKVEECGQYGVMFIEDGTKRPHLGNSSILDASTSKKIMQNTRKLVRACEAAVKMTNEDFGESIIRGARLVITEDEINSCMTNKDCYLYDEVQVRTKWATQKGVPMSCVNVTNQIRKEYGSKMKGSFKSLERSMDTLDSLCTATYYQTINFAEGN